LIHYTTYFQHKFSVIDWIMYVLVDPTVFIWASWKSFLNRRCNISTFNQVMEVIAWIFFLRSIMNKTEHTTASCPDIGVHIDDNFTIMWNSVTFTCFRGLIHFFLSMFVLISSQNIRGRYEKRASYYLAWHT
jgi:hypothetical protein